MSAARYRRCVVVGVGLIGGSVGLAARRAGLVERVVGVVRSEQRGAEAVAIGAVDEFTTDLGAACRDADLVVVATPVGLIAETTRRAAGLAADDALLTDAGSTKGAIAAAVGDAVPRFVAAHPLAGDHRRGPSAAREDLFDGATTILTPTAACEPAAITAVSAFWRSLGSEVVELTPEEHDRQVALSSHVPHVAASAVAAITPADALRFAATGWADTTRVAAGDPGLWRDILLSNAGAIAGGLRRLTTELEAYATAVESGDAATIERLLTEGKQQRDALGS